MSLTFSEYQARTSATAVYPESNALAYCTIGLCDEAGEVAGKVKKVMRDSGGIITPERKAMIKKELGDVMWYVSELCNVIGIDMSEIATENLQKLQDRAERGMIRGDGDTR